MPENFCLEDNYEECARCLAGLRARLSESIEDYLGGDTGRGKMKRRVPSYMDFSTIKRCTPAAALVLAAEYDRARSLVPWNIYLVNLDNWRRDLAELLDEIGFFSLLGIPRPERRDKRRDVTVVPFETGDTFGNNEAGPLTAALAEMIVSADPQGIMNADIRAARLRLTLPRYCPRS